MSPPPEIMFPDCLEKLDYFESIVPFLWKCLKYAAPQEVLPLSFTSLAFRCWRFCLQLVWAGSLYLRAASKAPVSAWRPNFSPLEWEEITASTALWCFGVFVHSVLCLECSHSPQGASAGPWRLVQTTLAPREPPWNHRIKDVFPWTSHRAGALLLQDLVGFMTAYC